MPFEYSGFLFIFNGNRIEKKLNEWKWKQIHKITNHRYISFVRGIWKKKRIFFFFFWLIKYLFRIVKPSTMQSPHLQSPKSLMIFHILSTDWILSMGESAAFHTDILHIQTTLYRRSSQKSFSFNVQPIVLWMHSRHSLVIHVISHSRLSIHPSRDSPKWRKYQIRIDEKELSFRHDRIKIKFLLFLLHLLIWMHSWLEWIN